MAEMLEGTIERVTYHDPDNGFVVLKVRAGSKRDPITVVGNVPRAVAGEHLVAEGAWQEDPDHGDQFRAISLRTSAPSTLEGIEKYLGSGLVKGIGPHFARKIVEVFGTRTLQVIDDSPSFLKEVKGLGPQRLQAIRESWKKQKAVRDILVFLQTHGIGTARAVRIHKVYGDRAVEKVRSDPYRLAEDVWGIGFATAEELGRKLGIDPQGPQRARAILRHVLREAEERGHCALPEAYLLEESERRLGIRSEVLAAALRELLEQGELIRETAATPEPWIYLRSLHLAEAGIAERLRKALTATGHPLQPIDTERALGWVEEKLGVGFAAQQREALREACGRRILIVTGGPGTGKTTLLRGIVEIYRARKLRVGLAAPTGRAARRLGESTAGEAVTLHRLLEYDRRGPGRDRRRPLDLDLLVVDEVSMVDVRLMRHLVEALPEQACMVLVGDVDQLPSVGPGRVLADLIESGTVPVVRLREIFRQAGNSLIVQAAHRVLQGEEPVGASEEHPGDFYRIESEDPVRIQQLLAVLVEERIPARFGFDGVRDVQVLAPMHRGELGVRRLNQLLQESLNPPQEGAVEVQRFGTVFRVGDKVLQTVNDYDREVFNGDVGRIRAIHPEEQELEVEFDGRRVVYEFDDLDELSLAYVLTIHKSQGSEYPAVVLILHRQHFLLLRRNLLYTALTRGKQLVVLVGSRSALRMAVERAEEDRRWSALPRRLSP